VATLHVHLDESGNFNFNPAGSKYYVFTAAWTYDPAPIAHALTTLRFGLLKQGHNLTHFHASEDKQVNRDAVVATLARLPDWNFAAVVIEKAKVNPSIREPHRFYPMFASSVLRFAFKSQVRSNTDTALVFTDSLPVNKFRGAAEKAIKLSCRRELPPEVHFECFHHPAASNPWIQAVDYCCWAVFKKWERQDLRTYDQLRHRLLAPELDALRRGAQRYY
jgi:hypothetical protein